MARFKFVSERRRRRPRLVGTMENALVQGIATASQPTSPTRGTTSLQLTQQQSPAPVSPVLERLFAVPALTPQTESAPQLDPVVTHESPVVTFDSSSSEDVGNSDDNSTVP